MGQLRSSRVKSKANVCSKTAVVSVATSESPCVSGKKGKPESVSSPAERAVEVNPVSSLCNRNKSESQLSEPLVREVRYVRKAYVCSRCEAWFAVIYRYAEKWLCCGCLKDIANAEGKSRLLVSCATFQLATDCRRAGHLQRVTSISDRKVNLVMKGLLQPTSRRVAERFCGSRDGDGSEACL